MENERKLKLLETMKKFNKDQKEIVFDFADTSPQKEVIPFGIKELDDFFGGGVPLRKYTVDYGAEDTGKSTRALHLVANCQKLGKIACYIDMERKFDPMRAEQFNVNLKELVLIQSAKTAEQAMDAIRLLAQDKVVDLVIVDSIQALSSKAEQETKTGQMKSIDDDTMALLARKLGQFFRMTSADIFRANMAVYLIGQVRTQGLGSFFVHGGLSGGNALHHWMSICTFSRKGQKSDSPQKTYKEYYLDPDGKVRFSSKNEEIGFDCVLKIEKSHISDSAKKNQEIHIPFYYDSGFIKVESKETVEEDIRIDGTEEEKELITKHLLEKGILKSEVNLAINPIQKDEQLCPSVQNITEETQEKKKSRGRPKRIDKAK